MILNTVVKSLFSITPNPALDLGGTVDRIVPDEKNYVEGETRFPGGNAINAARIIHRLGHAVELSGFLGGGIGNEIQGLLDNEGLKTRFIPVAESTRINITISNLNHHQTRLSYPGPNISASECGDLKDYIQRIQPGSLVMFGGSFPPGVGAEFLTEMLEMLAEMDCECVVDVPRPLLKSATVAPRPPLLIKPNLTEFQQLLGKKVASRQEVTTEARALTPRIPLVCVSSVEGGAILATPYGSWFGQIPKFQVNSTVGAGDSMVGAMCAQLSQWNFQTRSDANFAPQVTQRGANLLQWGLAAACATLQVHGTELGQADEIRRFLGLIRTERV